jgi:hypothetical protein
MFRLESILLGWIVIPDWRAFSKVGKHDKVVEDK